MSDKEDLRRPLDAPPYDGPTGFEAYAAVAEELDVEPDQRQAALDSLEPSIVDLARDYAKRSHKRWPPRPTQSGIRFVVIHHG